MALLVRATPEQRLCTGLLQKRALRRRIDAGGHSGASLLSKRRLRASRRRFALKVKFGYLKPEGVEKMWQAFFPQVEMPATARELRMLTPGDFNAAYGSLRFYDESDLTADAIINALKSEIAYKDGREIRRMGL